MPSSPKKPIRIFYLPITEKFYATQHYKVRHDVDDDTTAFKVTGSEYDVTDDIGYALDHFDIQFTSMESEGTDANS